MKCFTLIPYLHDSSTSENGSSALESRFLEKNSCQFNSRYISTLVEETEFMEHFSKNYMWQCVADDNLIFSVERCSFWMPVPKISNAT